MDSTRELVVRLLGHIGAGETARAAGLFAERLDFHIPHHPDVWWIPEVHTRADLQVFLEGLPRELETVRFEVDRVLVDGGDAVVLGTIEDRVRATGRSFTSRFALHLSVEDGRFVRYHFLEDSAAAHAAAR